MKKIKLAIVSVAALLGVVTMVPAYVSADAVDDARGGVNSVGGDEGGNATSLESRIETVVNIILFILGAIAVLMIILGGIRYTVSGGDSTGINNAKNTILYAVIGLIIAILAYAIVNFVVDNF